MSIDSSASAPSSLLLTFSLFSRIRVLLEIPGLTTIWYVRLADSNSTVLETQPNPIVLDVALAISMALGACANIALVIRFLERYCYRSTIIAMICLTVHDIMCVYSTDVTFGADADSPDSPTQQRRRGDGVRRDSPC